MAGEDQVRDLWAVCIGWVKEGGVMSRSSRPAQRMPRGEAQVIRTNLIQQVVDARAWSSPRAPSWSLGGALGSRWITGTAPRAACHRPARPGHAEIRIPVSPRPPEGPGGLGALLLGLQTVGAKSASRLWRWELGS